MLDLLDKTFNLTESRTTIRTEVLAGLTTFMTMSYILFVQPAVLSTTGMDFQAVLAATCIVSAFGTFLMGFLTNYPIAVAPAMGHNFFFAFTVVAGMGYTWQVALGAVFVSGIVFLLMSIWGVREALVRAIPDSLKRGIAVGIGLLITILTKFRNKGGEVYLMKPSENVQKLLVITKLNAIFQIIQSEDEVL